MTFDLNLTIASIIALVALLSPIITSVINNSHQLKLKKMENYELTKRKVLEEFIAASSKLAHEDVIQTVGEISEYNRCIGNLFLYFSDVPDEVKHLSDTWGNNYIKSLHTIVETLKPQIKTK